MDVLMSGNSTSKEIMFDEIPVELENYLNFSIQNAISYKISIDGVELNCSIKKENSKFVIKINTGE